MHSHSERSCASHGFSLVGNHPRDRLKPITGPISVPILKPRACEVCNKQDNLVRCSACQVVYYCDEEHRAADRPRHAWNCYHIDNGRALVEQERQILLHMPQGSAHPGSNLFETSPGHFGEIIEARAYIKNRWLLVLRLLESFGRIGGHAQAVEEALDHIMDVMFLAPTGWLVDLRPFAPALQIRLNQDQDAYCFCKRWLAIPRSDYTMFFMREVPLPDVTHADIFESTEMWTTNMNEFSHTSIVALIKARILVDLQILQSANRILRRIFPQEISDLIRTRLAIHVLQLQPELLCVSAEELSIMTRTIKTQVKSLYHFIDEHNKYFWYLLLERGSEAAKVRAPRRDAGSEGEACSTIHNIYEAWAENPRSIRVMQDLRYHVNGGYYIPELYKLDWCNYLEGYRY